MYPRNKGNFNGRKYSTFFQYLYKVPQYSSRIYCLISKSGTLSINNIFNLDHAEKSPIPESDLFNISSYFCQLCEISMKFQNVSLLQNKKEQVKINC